MGNQDPTNMHQRSLEVRADHALESMQLGGDVQVDLGGQWSDYSGLGEVRVGGMPLRSGRLPMSVEIRTPDGLALTDWRVTAMERGDAGVHLSLEPMVRSVEVMEWMVHETRPRVRIDDWTSPTERAEGTTLQLEVERIERRVGAFQGVGLRYQYTYDSATMPIYRILDRGSWEPGGSCVDCAFWNRACVPPIASFAAPEDEFSSEWYLPEARNPHVFQFQPWQTHLQGFTYTTCGEGVLVTWAHRVAHIRSLFEKRAGWAELLHLHEQIGRASCRERV